MPGPAERELELKPSFGFLLLLGLGHLLTDVNQGAIPALLPYLQEAFGLSYAAVGSLLMVSNLASSVVQPLFGLYSDRSSRRWLLPSGLLLAGLGVASAGWISYLPLLYLAVALSGLGIASYHPEASRIARYLGGEKRATGMSLYSIGGNVGFALGPLAVSLALATRWGMRGTVFFLFPALSGSLLFLSLLPSIARREVTSARALASVGKGDEGPNLWGAEAMLLAIVMLRSLFQFGVVTFLPFYCLEFLGWEKEAATRLLSWFLFSGAIGTLLGGPLADRFGTKTLLVSSLGLVVPLHLLLLHAMGGPFTVPLVAALGLVLVSSFTVSLVMSQEFLPRNVGMASGLNVGLSIGLGGVGATVLGAIADRWGLVTTLRLLPLFPTLGFLLGVMLPGPARREVIRLARGPNPGE